MAGKSNTSATFFAQKKLLGKAHTSNLRTDGEELIGSNIQSSTNLLFGETIPNSPTRTLNTVQGGTVEYIQFVLEEVTGNSYDANDTGGGAGSDSGESGQDPGPHTYKFKLPSNYTSISANPNKGNGVFDNDKVVHETLGALQLIPPFYSQAAPNPYIIKIYKDDGAGGVGSEIPLLDNIDWNVDAYNGILFLQDYDASKIPAFARAFAYVGKMASTVISEAGGGGGTPGGSNTQIQFNDGGSFGGDADLTYNKTTNTLQSAGFITASLGFSGSLTRLTDGTSYIKSGKGINVVSSSNGSITLKVNKELVFNEKLSGNANGANTLFSLANTPFATNEISIFVNGQLQTPPGLASFQDYSVTGSNVFFTTGSTPERGSLVMAIYQKVTS
jgi:hypothetical protein